ncbi:MAG: T9SS C-terminal target domain-containing protein [Chitinophagia bacterium]|nr:T9SS C-terminal target domain-containing protein [Chitinophagia bacterium]
MPNRTADKIFTIKHLSFFVILLLAVVPSFAARFPILSNITIPHVAPHRLIVNSDGSFVVLGTIAEPGIGNTLQGRGFTVTKYDSTGNLLWLTRADADMAHGNWMYATDMIKGVDSGYAVVGDSTYITGMTSSPNYMFAAKINENGSRSWTRAFLGTNANCYGTNIKIRSALANTAYYISDYAYIYKLDNTGSLLTRYTNPGVNAEFAIYRDTGIAFTAGGLSRSTLIFTDSACSIMLYDSFGYNVRPYDVYHCPDGCWLVTSVKPFSNSRYAIFLHKFNPTGRLIWEKMYDYNDLVIGLHTFQSGNSYYIAASYKTCLNADLSARCVGFSTGLLLQTDTAGNVNGMFTAPGDTTTAGLDSAISYSFYQADAFGDSLIILGTKQILDLRFLSAESQRTTQTAVWKVHNTLPPLSIHTPYSTTNGQALTLFPNPNTGSFTVAQPLPIDEDAVVEIYNMMGSCVYRATTHFTAGKTIITPNSLPAGNYMLRLINSKASYALCMFTVQE